MLLRFAVLLVVLTNINALAADRALSKEECEIRFKKEKAAMNSCVEKCRGKGGQAFQECHADCALERSNQYQACYARYVLEW